MRRTTMLPVLMVIVIGLLTLILVASTRSGAPEIVADKTFPHFVCTINRYCEGDECSDDPISFLAYTRHEGGLPRLELDGFSTRAILSEIPDGRVFESTGGRVSGTIKIFDDRGLDLIGTSGSGVNLVEHYASGGCERFVE